MNIVETDLLAPLDGINVYPFLHHFPQRTHLSQLVDSADDSFDDKVDFRFRSEPPNPESQGAMSHIFSRTESAENIGGFEGRRCASRSR